MQAEQKEARTKKVKQGTGGRKEKEVTRRNVRKKDSTKEGRKMLGRESEELEEV